MKMYVVTDLDLFVESNGDPGFDQTAVAITYSLDRAVECVNSIIESWNNDIHEDMVEDPTLSDEIDELWMIDRKATDKELLNGEFVEYYRRKSKDGSSHICRIFIEEVDVLEDSDLIIERET